MTPPPTLEEVDDMIARFTVIREKWKGVPAYARLLDIELLALHQLAVSLRTFEPKREAPQVRPHQATAGQEFGAVREPWNYRGD